MINFIKIYFFKIKIKKIKKAKLRIIKDRILILDALLLSKKNSERIKQIKILYKKPIIQLQKEFRFNKIQAEAINSIKKDILEIQDDSIFNEKTNLINQYNELINKLK